MTRVADLGQFDLTKLLPQQLQQTVRDVVNVANDPTSAIKSVAFWSAYTPPRAYTGAQLNELYRDPTPNPYLKVLRPVIVLDTIVGQKVIAPYGIPAQNEWEANTKRIALGGLFVAAVGITSLIVVGAALGRVRS